MYKFQILDLNPAEISEDAKGFLHTDTTKAGKPYRFALITSDEKQDFNRDKEAAKIGAMLKITSKYGPSFSEFKEMLPGVAVPTYFKQRINGKEIFGWGYWMTKPEDEQAVLGNISKIVSYLNSQDGKDPISYNTPEDLTQVKEYWAMLRQVAADVAATASQTTKELLDNYINQLADQISDEKLLDDIARFNKAAKAYILDTGKYSYSIGNIFLIWLQADPKAREFGSKPYWEGKGYQPKKDAKGILIIKPSKGNSVGKNYEWIKKNKPDIIRLYNKELGRPETTPIAKEKEYSVVTFAMKNRLIPMQYSNSFTDVQIYDNLNVEPIPGREQTQEPEGLKWYNDSQDDDDKSRIMIEALEQWSNENGINVKRVDDLGGAKGTSSGGHIKLLTNSVGAGLLSVFVHEIAHELLHQPANKDKFHGKFYIGRDHSRNERELHAEAIAYTVMKTYGYPIQHSVNYIAGWKNDKDKVKKYQKIIRDTSFFIIQQIEVYGDRIAKTQDTDPEVGVAPDFETQAGLNESLELLKNIILEFKNTVDLVAKVEALIAKYNQLKMVKI